MKNRTCLFTTLAFKGPRFDGHALDLAVLPELTAYRTLLIETAKELWRAANPGRERLPKGFESRLSLGIHEIQAGSLVLPILRQVMQDDDEFPIDIDDEFSRGARIIDDVLARVAAGQQPPHDLPAAIIPLFDDLGKTLADDEWLEIRPTGAVQPIRWDAGSRERIAAWIPRTYTDSVEYRGEVTQADVEGCTFTLKLDVGDKVTGKFSSDQESFVTQALQAHQTVRLRVTGRAEFLHSTGKPRRFLDTPTVAISHPEDDAYDPAERPFWEVMIEIAASIPDSELEKLPVDGALNHDRYLTGRNPP
jgi:hypothetical protein